MTGAPAPEPAPRRLGANATWLLIAQVVVVAIGLLTTVAISRLLGPEELGRWRFAQAVFAYGLVIADAGLSILAIREIAKSRAAVATYGFPIIVMQVAAAVVVYLVVLGAVLISDLPDMTKVVVALFGLGIFPQALSLAHVLQAHERMELVARLRILIQGASGVAGLVGLFFTRNLIALIVPILVVNLLTDAWIARRVNRDHGVRFRLPPAGRMLGLTREGVPFLLSSLAMLLIFNADAIMLEILSGEVQLGLYAAAYAPASQTLMLAGPVMAAAYPRLARLASAADQGLSLLRPLLQVLGLLILPVAIGGIVVADQVIAFLYGAGYEASVPVLAILMGLPLVGFYNMGLIQTISARGHQSAVMKVSFAAAAANIGTNLVLIPTMGIGGAALATLLAEVVSSIAYSTFLLRRYESVVVADYLSSLPAALAMGAVVLVAKATIDVSLLAAVAIGAATYAAASLAFPTPGARIAVTWLRSAARR